MKTAEQRSSVILHIDDDTAFRDLWTVPMRRKGYEVHGAETLTGAREVLDRRFVDLLMVDERMGRESGIDFLREIRRSFPGLGAIVVSGHADYAMAVRAMELGAVSILSKPLSEQLLLEKVQGALESSELAREARYHRWYAAHEAGFPEIVGQSDTIRRVLASVRKAAPTQATVLIQGESGTGKELIARAIHAASGRRGQRFHAENLGAIAPSLVESTLFGHVRGAFTDAKTDRVGLFEAANRGTLFLDEIGEASLDVQVRLLRALDQKSITRVGDNHPKSVDVRLIAATNRNLIQAMEARTFREDLYYRLQVVVIDVPPLRARVDDIEPLATYLLAQQNRQQGKHLVGFEPDALRKLQSYHWPGNVRELRNAIESAVIHAESQRVVEGDIVLRRVPQEVLETSSFLDRPYREAVREFDRIYFGKLLRDTDNNKTVAAQKAGLDRSSLHDHLRKLESRSETDAKSSESDPPIG